MNTQITELTGIVRVENTDKPIFKLAHEVRKLPENYPDIDGWHLLAWQPDEKGGFLAGWLRFEDYWINGGSHRGGFWGTDSNWYLIALSDPRNRPILQHLGVIARTGDELLDDIHKAEIGRICKDDDPTLGHQDALNDPIIRRNLENQWATRPGQAIVPERAWKQSRVIDICRAIDERMRLEEPADREWLDELARLNDWLEGGEQ